MKTIGTAVVISSRKVKHGLPPAPHAKWKKSKYRNEPMLIDGIRFDSKKEALRWRELKLLESAGKISGLERQVEFPLAVNGVVVCCYRADAVYLEDGKRVVEDTKSEITRRHPVYRLKRKLLAAALGVEIRET